MIKSVISAKTLDRVYDQMFNFNNNFYGSEQQNPFLKGMAALAKEAFCQN